MFKIQFLIKGSKGLFIPLLLLLCLLIISCVNVNHISYPNYYGHNRFDTLLISNLENVDANTSVRLASKAKKKLERCIGLVTIDINEIYYVLQQNYISIPSYSRYDSAIIHEIEYATGADYLLLSKIISSDDGISNLNTRLNNTTESIVNHRVIRTSDNIEVINLTTTVRINPFQIGSSEDSYYNTAGERTTNHKAYFKSLKKLKKIMGCER